MARGINKAILVGNLGADPETRSFPNGGSVTKVSLATSRSWKDKQTGEQREKTEWHRVEFYNRLGEIAAQYLRKGSQIYVEGSIETQKWQDQQGNDRYSTIIRGFEMQMLGGRAGMGGPSDDGGFGGGAPSSGGGQSGGGQSGGGGDFQAPPSQDFDDDIPF